MCMKLHTNVLLVTLITVTVLLTVVYSTPGDREPKSPELFVKNTHKLPGCNIPSSVSISEVCTKLKQEAQNSARILNSGPVNQHSINLHTNSNCVLIYEADNCNEYGKPGLHIQYFDSTAQNEINLKLDTTEPCNPKLPNFNLETRSFMRCAAEEQNKKLQHISNTSISVQSDHMNFGIGEGDTCKNFGNKKLGKVTLIYGKSNANPTENTCVEVFTENECKGNRFRYLIPPNSVFWSHSHGVIWSDTDNNIQIKSIRRCAYCSGNLCNAFSQNQQPAFYNACNFTNVSTLKETLTQSNNCFLFYNTSSNKCGQPLVKAENISTALLVNLWEKYPIFRNWSSAPCEPSGPSGSSSSNSQQANNPIEPNKTLQEILSELHFRPHNRWLGILVSAGACLAVLLLIIAAIVIFLVCRRKRKIRALRKRCIPTIRVDPLQHMYQSDELLDSNQVNDVARLKMLCASFSDGYEIPRNMIDIGNRDSTANMIGVGEFSIVMKGCLKTQCRTVAVKTMKPGSATPKTIKWALRECQVFKQLGKHPRILEFFGVCTAGVRNGELFVVMELCERGCLKGFLAQQKNRFTTFVEDGEWVHSEKLDMALQSQIFIEDEPPVTFNTLQLLKWCIEVADAMTFLTEQKIVHVSLSAKNVLLDANFSSKISDFHLVKLAGVVVPSTTLVTNTSRKNQPKERIVPWRWYAMESLEDDVFNRQTDLWTFGVFMWEVFSLGATPYPEFTFGPEFILAIKHGYRLQAPNFATTECYQLMLMCWNEAPEKRLPFAKLKSKLEEMLTTKNSPVLVSRSFQIIKSLSNF